MTCLRNEFFFFLYFSHPTGFSFAPHVTSPFFSLYIYWDQMLSSQKPEFLCFLLPSFTLNGVQVHEDRLTTHLTSFASSCNVDTLSGNVDRLLYMLVLSEL